MAREYMTKTEIEIELNELGETGNVKLRGSGLYVQREENADWLFVGSVEDVEEAKTAISEHFNQ